MASSGSSAAIGSMSGSKLDDPAPIPNGTPSSPAITGEFMRISDNMVPGRAWIR